MEIEITITFVLIICLCLWVFTIWNIRHKEKTLLLSLSKNDELRNLKCQFSDSFHIRLLSHYGGYDVAIGVNRDRGKKQLIIELLLEIPTMTEMKIQDPKSLLFRKDKKKNGIWIGEYLEMNSELKLSVFESLIRRIEKRKDVH